MTDIYQQALIAEFREPQNQGALENPDIHHHETNASCGDEVTITLRFSADKTRVEEVKWVGKGCTVSQASMSLLSEKLKGASLEQVMQWQKQDLLPFFGMEDIVSGREKCFLMGLKTVQKAVNLWKTGEKTS